MNKISPFITLNGTCETAMQFYADNLPNTKIEKCVKYGEMMPDSGDDTKNLVMYGALSISGNNLFFLDMDPAHTVPEMSWASSLYIDCTSEEEFTSIHNALANGGSVMMGPESVGDIRKCSWVVDKFGVVWQPVWK